MLYKEFKTQGDFLFRYRGSLPLFILLAGLGVYILTKLNSGSESTFLNSTVFTFISLGVTILGQIVRIITVGFTPVNTSGRNKYYQVADEVNTTGIYSTVRHPLYLGNFFMWLGIGMLTQNIWFVVVFILFYWVYYERIMYAEEMFLFNKFGDKYEKWAEKTPAFIPSLKSYKKAPLEFSWKKILKKEKNGFAAIFVLFYFFDFAKNIIESGKFVIVLNFWFYAAAISTIIYFILKYMKWKTSLLNEEGR